MSKQTINIGASPNDGTGTPLRTSFDYTNQNFTELYTALGGGVGLPGATTQVIFNDGGTNLAGDAGLVYNKTTDALTVAGLVTAGSAAITGAATVGTTLGVTGVSTFAAGTVSLPALTTTGDTNTGIYYPAADTFAVTTGGTERYRVNSSGNVGIKITPSVWASGATALQISSFAHIAQQTNGSSNVGFGCYESSANAFTYSTGDAPTLYSQLNGQHKFYTAVAGTAGDAITFGNAKMTLNSVGNLTLDAGNLIMGTSGKGIDFSATANSSGTMTSELLNDYEEGTFTPAVEGTTSSGTASYNSRAGRYTKVGKLVTVQVYIDWTAGTGTGFLCFSGLPFTIANNADEYASATIGYINNVALAASSVPCALGYPSRTRFELNQLLVGGGANAAVTYDAAGSIAFTATYFV